MKRLLHAVAYFGILVISGGLVGAAEPQFRLTLANSELVVSLAKGDAMTSIHSPAIGRVVELAGVSFQVSFGQDGQGNYSAIISPNPDHAEALDFEFLGHQVSLDKVGLLTATFAPEGSHLTFEPGFVGQTTVDGKVITERVAIGSSPARPVSAVEKKLPVADNPVSSTPDAPARSNAGADAVSAVQNTSSVASPGDDSVSVELASDFRAKHPDADMVKIAPTQTFTDQDMSRMLSAGQVAQKQIFWAEPVTPPDPSQAPAVGDREIKLEEVRGDVKVTNLQGKVLPAKAGDTIESGCKVGTGEDSSVAILIGGIDSVRLTPQTSATIASTLAGDQRTTLIQLSEGVTFNKVGQKDGLKQDFRIQTVTGVAAARGTDFSTSEKAGRLVVMCAQGAVEVFDSAQNLVGTATPKVARSLGYVAVGGTPASLNDRSREVLEILSLAAGINAKVNAILERQAAGQAPSALESAYLQKVATVELAILPITTNEPLLVNRQLPSASVVQSISTTLMVENPRIGASEPATLPPTAQNNPLADPVTNAPSTAKPSLTPSFNPLALTTPH